MKGITFGNLHSYDDLKLILTSKEIGSPAVKERKIDIEGADSSLDLTDFFGEAKYEDVTHKFSFSTIVPQSHFLSLFSILKNALHGKKMRIILDDDPHFYYLGRVKLSSFTNEKNIGMVSVECDCEPYKYKLQPTSLSVTVDGASANIYDISKTTLVSTAIKKHEDDFFEIDATNNGEAWQYITFFHAPFASGEVAPNQKVTIMLETKDFEVSGSTETKLFFTSNNDAQPDYFAPSSYSARIDTNSRSTYALYPVAIKDDATIAAAVYFIRSFIALAPGSKCKGKFRISILPGDVKANDFAYVSHDGSMRGLQIVNGRKRAVPTITTTSPFTIYHEGNIYSVGAGSSTIPEMELREGINDIAVRGSGTITFTWQEGEL
jgi:hypothetical protein